MLLINICVNFWGVDYTIIYYNEAVRRSIGSWPEGVRANLVRIIERMAQDGPDLGLPYTRAMGGGLFEMRARGAEGIGRAFFCLVSGKRVIVLHGFIKKTEKTPDRDMAVARRRLKEVKHGSEKDR